MPSVLRPPIAAMLMLDTHRVFHLKTQENTVERVPHRYFPSDV